MKIVWRLRGITIRTTLCWIEWHNVHSQQHIYMSSSYRSNRLGLSHWDPYAVAWCCIIVTWWSGSGGIQAWSWRPTGCLQCFNTVGLVIWPVKIIPEVTYNVLSGTLSLYTMLMEVFIFIVIDKNVNGISPQMMVRGIFWKHLCVMSTWQCRLVMGCYEYCRYCESRRKVLLDHVHEGYDKDFWEYMEAMWTWRYCAVLCDY